MRHFRESCSSGVHDPAPSPDKRASIPGVYVCTHTCSYRSDFPPDNLSAYRKNTRTASQWRQTPSSGAVRDKLSVQDGSTDRPFSKNGPIEAGLLQPQKTLWAIYPERGGFSVYHQYIVADALSTTTYGRRGPSLLGNRWPSIGLPQFAGSRFQVTGSGEKDRAAGWPGHGIGPVRGGRFSRMRTPIVKLGKRPAPAASQVEILGNAVVFFALLVTNRPQPRDAARGRMTATAPPVGQRRCRSALPVRVPAC